jgi:ABC-type cobalamin/Fe3+-siderophores transport system ATPase subunit
VLLDRGRVVASGPTAQVLRPDVLAPVYQVDVRVVPDGDAVQLVFRPRRPPGGPTESARTHVHDSIGELA